MTFMMRLNGTTKLLYEREKKTQENMQTLRFYKRQNLSCMIVCHTASYSIQKVK